MYSKGVDKLGNKLTDALIATGKGAVSLFPGGGILAEYISLAQGYVADKRMNEWKQKVEEVLEKIPRSIDELAQDEAFYSCVQVATMGAMRAYQKESRNFLLMHFILLQTILIYLLIKNFSIYHYWTVIH